MTKWPLKMDTAEAYKEVVHDKATPKNNVSSKAWMSF